VVYMLCFVVAFFLCRDPIRVVRLLVACILLLLVFGSIFCFCICGNVIVLVKG